MHRIILVATLLVLAGGAFAPTAAAIPSIEELCERHTGLCSPSWPGCWIENLVPPKVRCIL